MYKKVFLALVLWFLIAPMVVSQDGPGGVFYANGADQLQLWLDATDLDADGRREGNSESGLITSGTQVDRWTNKSGYTGRDAGANQEPWFIASHSGLNNMSVVDLKSGRFLQAYNNRALSPSSQFTIFIVMDDQSFCSNCPVFNHRTTYNTGMTIEGSASNFKTSSYQGGWSSIGSSGWSSSSPYVFSTQVASSGRNQYRNGVLVASGSGTTSWNVTAKYLLGANTINTGVTKTVKLGEVIYYDGTLNDAQRIIVTNYLSAKFNVPLPGNDVYNEDDVAAGDYDFDVAGIGRVDVSNIHDSAQGTGIIKIFSPSDLDDNEYLFWGDDNGSLSTATITNTTYVRQLNRTWRVSETNLARNTVDVGTVDMEVDLAGVSPFSAVDRPFLLVDSDNDGDFTDETPTHAGTDIGGNVFRFTAVSELQNNLRFTFVIPKRTAITNRNITYRVNN